MNKHGGIEIQLYDNTIYFKEMNRGVTMAQKTPGAQENTMAQKSYNHETGKWEYVQPPSGHYIPPRPIVLDLSAIDRQFRKQEEAKYERLIQERSLKRSRPSKRE